MRGFYRLMKQDILHNTLDYIVKGYRTIKDKALPICLSAYIGLGGGCATQDISQTGRKADSHVTGSEELPSQRGLEDKIILGTPEKKVVVSDPRGEGIYTKQVTSVYATDGKITREETEHTDANGDCTDSVCEEDKNGDGNVDKIVTFI